MLLGTLRIFLLAILSNSVAAYIFKLETSGMSIWKRDRQTPVLRIHEFEMTFFEL